MVDMHIRNLMITYFFRFFEQLVHDGHLYVLETPLFRVRNKERTIYCYSESERDKAVTELGGKPEITCFKGLGEISAKEFAQIIGLVLADAQRTQAKGLHHGQARRAGGGVKRINRAPVFNVQRRIWPKVITVAFVRC